MVRKVLAVPTDDPRVKSSAPPPPESLRSQARRLYGVDPLGYEAGRPEYPKRVYDVLTERCGLVAGARVLEIGPGTGRVTRRLLKCGAQVVALEPDPALAAHLSRELPGDFELIRESFEDVQLEDADFDLVVAAMSFHWVDQNVGLAKLGRVVRPDGWVAVWWTVFGDITRPDPFRDATRELLNDSGDPRGPQFELDVEQRRLDLLQLAGLIDVEGELIQWTHRMDKAQLRALCASTIAILRRPQPEQRRILDAVVAIATEQFGGVVERPFVTALYTGRRPATRPAD